MARYANVYLIRSVNEVWYVIVELSCLTDLTCHIFGDSRAVTLMNTNMSNPIDAASKNNNALSYLISPTIRARIIPTDKSSLRHAGSRLKSGQLVSFPTETVYGIGCHAFDPSAIQRVFKAKERPLTDPLIVHVCRLDEAWKLWHVDNHEARALRSLAEVFWPGPLTLIARADSLVPSVLTADTGFVAVRCPSHPIARELITYAGVPVAAPSANKFGHVSPTRAQHVWDDLLHEDVWILDPQLTTNERNVINGKELEGEKQAPKFCCTVGVESTVVKVQMAGGSFSDGNNKNMDGSVQILRRGAVSNIEVQKCLLNAGLVRYCCNNNGITAEKHKEHEHAVFTVGQDARSTGTDIRHVAPGQMIRHYSPHVDICCLISHVRQSVSASATQNDNDVWSKGEIEVLSKSVVIDYGGRLRWMALYALAYWDLSPDNNSSEAASMIFEVLRWSETVKGGCRVYLPEIKMENWNNEVESEDALMWALKDRFTRAASGIVVEQLM